MIASCRDGGPPTTSTKPTLFREIAESVGLDVEHDLGVLGEFRLPEIMGSGGAVFDADGDGDLDIYLVQCGKDEGDGAPNRLFLREGARYVEAENSGLEDRGFGMGAAVADVDNDGDIDVFVTNWGRDALYLNRGDGRFDEARDSGITAKALSTSCAFLDYDLDGLLDLWVCGYVNFIRTRECYGDGGRREYCGPRAFDGSSDVLYRNLGGGRFADVSRRAGIVAPAASLGVIVDHFDDDGRVDVFVANDQESNQLWIYGNGGFTDEALARGVAVNGMGAAESSMGVASGDVDGDGRDDLFMTHLRAETNTLYKRLEGDGFRDATMHARLAEPSLSLTGFGTAFFDFENDGDLDLAAVNGRVARGERSAGEIEGPLLSYGEPNQLFLNDGRGRFTDVSEAAFGDLAEVSRGLIPFDHDGDGDLDLLVTNCAGRVRLFENLSEAGRWLRVEPWDDDLGRAVLGARIVLHLGDEVRAATFGTTAGYLSSWLVPLHFGLGDRERVDSIEVVWPGGERETFAGSEADRIVRVTRGGGGK